MNILNSIYQNSSIYILSVGNTQNIPIVKLIIMYIFNYGALLFALIGIYIILTSKEFFPPIYFTIEDILQSNEYGFSGLIAMLIGNCILFPLYIWYFFFGILILFLMWWIYKKLMIRYVDK